MYDLNGKVALVTGAGGRLGIGRAIAIHLARDGADIAVNDIAAPPAPEWGGAAQVVREIQDMGRRAISIPGDVSDALQVEEMVARTLDQFGHIDILVNNAGSPVGKDRVPVVDLEEEVWNQVQNINSRGTFLCCRAVARKMIARNQGGKIINMSSTKGKQGAALHAAYAASKFAVIGFTQSLAEELAPHRINVNAICPGLVASERMRHIAAALKPEGESTEAHFEHMLEEGHAKIPLGRVGEGADIARTAAFLAAPESDYITGQAISVNGGAQMS